VPSDDAVLYVIAAYEFDVKGRSRSGSLLYKLVENGEFREGEIITGKANLEKYISDITQIYINQRVLKDNVEVAYSTGDVKEDGTLPVTITVKVEDTWNIIALPRPYYKNDVFDLTIKARDYNFFGTMQPLRIDLGYNYNEDKRHSFMLGVFYDTTFKALDHYWNITFDNTFMYRVDAPVYYQNFTGLSMDQPFHSTTFTFGINERTILNDENPDWAKNEGYGTYQDGMYMASYPYVSWKIPTGLTVSRYGELTYNPRISATIIHEFPKWPMADFNKGPFVNFGHSLGFEKIDWHENFRKGLSFFVGNSYQYDFHRNFFDISFDFKGVGHFIISEFFAISSRLMYQYSYSSDEFNEGGYISSNLRGIADNSITAYQSFVFNLDLPFRLFVFRPSKWLNSRKYAFFDFELHASPVFDLALYYQRSFNEDIGKTFFSKEQLAATSGLEFVVFPLFMRNLYIRLGFAVNIKDFTKGIIKERKVDIPGDNNREIYLIMGHFF